MAPAAHVTTIVCRCARVSVALALSQGARLLECPAPDDTQGSWGTSCAMNQMIDRSTRCLHNSCTFFSILMCCTCSRRWVVSWESSAKGALACNTAYYSSVCLRSFRDDSSFQRAIAILHAGVLELSISPKFDATCQYLGGPLGLAGRITCHNPLWTSFINAYTSRTVSYSPCLSLLLDRSKR
jgi:hypothetical protein